MTKRRRISRIDQKGRTKKQDGFIRLNHRLLDSVAWRSLTAQERAVLIETMKLHNGSNNGRIGFSCRQAARACNINKDTANKAFKRLVELGFLKQTSEGGFSYKVRHSPTWEVTEFAVGREEPTKEYRDWTPGKYLGPI